MQSHVMPPCRRDQDRRGPTWGKLSKYFLAASNRLKSRVSQSEAVRSASGMKSRAPACFNRSPYSTPGTGVAIYRTAASSRLNPASTRAATCLRRWSASASVIGTKFIVRYRSKPRQECGARDDYGQMANQSSAGEPTIGGVDDAVGT